MCFETAKFHRISDSEIVHIVLIRTMAKIINQKKRVARVKSGLDEEIEGGCRDYVSSIIKEMDLNFKVKSYNLNFPKSSVVSSNENATESVKGTCSPPTSKDSAKINKILSSNKFGMPRKFPLMEKSQKILKHIRHNQRIPKQRAHLASLPMSPSKKSTACSNSVVPTQKKNNQKCEVTKLKRNKVPINKNFVRTGNSMNNEITKQNASEMTKDCKKVNRYEIKGSSDSENAYNDGNASDQKNDTTDSEYERFLQSSKKNLKRKSSSKTKSMKKLSKKTCKSTTNSKITKLSDYHSDDDTSSSSQCKKREKTKHMNKKKRRYNVLFSDSENDFINGEVFTRGTSSESDVADTECVAKSCSDSELVEETKEESCVTSQPLNVKKNVMDSLCDNVSGIENITEENDLPTFEESVKDKIILDSTLVTTKTFIADNSKNATCELPILPLPERKTCTDQPSEEESDIEIIDIISPKTTNSTVRAEEGIKTNVISSVSSVKQKNSQIQMNIKHEKQTLQNDSVKDGENEAVYITGICKEFNEDIDSKINILKQPNTNDPVVNASNRAKNTILYNKTEQNIELKKEDSDDDIVVVDCILNKDNKSEVKRKVSNTINNSTNNPNVKKENASKSLVAVSKMDPCSSENINLKDLKLYGVACSNFTHSVPGEIAQKITPLIQPKEIVGGEIDVKKLLDLFKKEFQIYQEIIQTEADVEKSLKTIESYQAEKLKNIRSLIQKVVESNNCLDKDNNPEVHANLLYKSEEINKLLSSQNKITPECSSKIQDFRNPYLQETSKIINTADSILPNYSVRVPAQNNLSSSALVDNDVKPNLSMLHNTSKSVLAHNSTISPKLEQEIASASTIKLLGEKCNVCGKEAVAACQRCAKVFFCSNECGKRYWIDGHKYECGD